MLRLRSTLLALVAPIVIGVSPAAAQATIVPGVSISGAKLGDSSAQISKRFGEHPTRLGVVRAHLGVVPSGSRRIGTCGMPSST